MPNGVKLRGGQPLNDEPPSYEDYEPPGLSRWGCILDEHRAFTSLKVSHRDKPGGSYSKEQMVSARGYLPEFAAES